MYANRRNFRDLKEIGIEEHGGHVRFKNGSIWPFRACAMHPAIIIGTVRSLWTWLWGRYHVPQNVFLVVLATPCQQTTLQLCADTGRVRKPFNFC